jgi:hypothetical protein
MRACRRRQRRVAREFAVGLARSEEGRKKRKVRIRIVTTLAGDAGLEAKPKTTKKADGAAKARTVTVRKGLGREGRHKIKVSRLKRGTTYKLTLTVTSADGQQVTDNAKLKVKKK